MKIWKHFSRQDGQDGKNRKKICNFVQSNKWGSFSISYKLSNLFKVHTQLETPIHYTFCQYYTLFQLKVALAVKTKKVYKDRKLVEGLTLAW